MMARLSHHSARSALATRAPGRLTIGLFTFIFLSSLWCELLGREVMNSSSLFPLSEGTTWTYQGVVRWSHENSNDVSERQVTWTTQVKRVTRRQHLIAAVINGFPSDLNWSDGHPQPNDSLLLASDDGGYYVRPFGDVKDGVKRLENPSDSLQDLIDPDDLFLQLPLAKGKKFCGDTEQMAREDDEYCWVVSSVDRISLLKVKGLEPKQYEVYEVSFRTNPDDTKLQFLPGVGLIRYQYHHHGTVAETDMELVAFHSGAAGN
jgi:hypothetical protein